ncbi:MAG TPA: glutamate decarboxylase [Bacillota bacterium]|nr:glutamate decarboxylase [Bacillota bacterium]HPT87024.1 glutamate decarboxylase [Bacillota bacterium]
MWVVVYVAPNRKVAMYLKQLLEVEGILVKLKEARLSENEDRNVEVMVSEIEIEEANEVINNALQRP